MPLLATRRARLTSGVVAICALVAVGATFVVTSGPAKAQTGAPAIDCDNVRRGEGVSRPDRALSRNLGRLERPPGLNTAMSVIDGFNPATGDINQLRAAMADCEAAKRNGNSYYAQSYLCLADGSRKLAQAPGQNVESSYRTAYCWYDFGAALADTRGNTDEARRLAGIGQEGRGDMLLAIHDLAPGTSQANEYREEATEAFAAAIAERSTAARRMKLSLGRLHQNRVDSASDQDDARDNIGRAYDTRGDGSIRNQADLAVALVRVGTTTGVRDSGTLLGWAAPLSPGSVAVHSALGAAHFNAGRYAEARTAYAAAVANAGQDTSVPGSTNYLAQAAYGLGVIEIIQSRQQGRQTNWQDVLSNATFATTRAGSVAPEHRRLRCLAYVRYGWRRDEQVQRDICSFSGTAEGHLLRGMLSLREAQYLNPNNVADTPARRAYRAAINEASAAFNAGLEAVANGGNPNATADWRPELDGAFNIRHVLEYGRSFIAHNCPLPELERTPTALPQELRTAGYNFYNGVGLYNCGASYRL